MTKNLDLYLKGLRRDAERIFAIVFENSSSSELNQKSAQDIIQTHFSDEAFKSGNSLMKRFRDGKFSAEESDLLNSLFREQIIRRGLAMRAGLVEALFWIIETKSLPALVSLLFSVRNNPKALEQAQERIAFERRILKGEADSVRVWLSAQSPDV